MAELRKHALLLIILAALLFIKFVVVPIFAWQDGIIYENNALEKRLAKIERVLASEDKINATDNKLNEQLVNAEKLLFNMEDEASFKLAQQQVIEKFLEKHSLSSSNIGWQTKSYHQESGLFQYQVQIIFDGQFVDMIYFFTELESNTPWFQIFDFNVSIRAKSEGVPGRVKNARVKLNLYANG